MKTEIKEVGIKKVDDVGIRIAINDVEVKKVDDVGIKIEIKEVGIKSWWFRNKNRN